MTIYKDKSGNFWTIKSEDDKTGLIILQAMNSKYCMTVTRAYLDHLNPIVYMEDENDK